MSTWVIVFVAAGEVIVLLMAYLLGRGAANDARYRDGYHDGWSTCDRTWVNEVVIDGRDPSEPRPELPLELRGVNPNAVPRVMGG